MDPILRVEGVKAYFYSRKGIFGREEVRALDGVTLDVGRGETVAVVGESGSGKTTLGRTSLRLIEPNAGRIVFDGTEISHSREKDLRGFRRRAQAIFQNPYSSMNPFMTVRESVEEPLLIHGVVDREERRSRMIRALEDVKLIPGEEFALKYPHMLSGGQRQRIGIARALVLRPEYIVADEPVSMIDASSRAEILYLMKSLQTAYRISFMYITHDIATARQFSDRIAVMYLGRIVELGQSGKIVEEPLHPYTQALIEAVPEPDPANLHRFRRTIPGEPPSPSQIPPGCRFHPRCPSFMNGRCEVVEPELQEVRSGHFVACYLY